MWSIAAFQSFPLMITFTLFMLLICILLCTFNFIKSYQTRKSINLPPCPPNKLPIIGHLHQLGHLPHLSLQTLARKHGSFMLLNLGLSPTLVVSSSQAAKEIMKTHDLIFCNRPIQRFKERLFYGKDMAFTRYSEYWIQMRRLCILQIFSAKRVQSFRSVIEEEVQVMIKKISNSSQLVNLSQIMVTLTNDIICRVVFGRKFPGEKDAKRFDEMSYLLGVFNVGDYIPWLSWINHFNGLNARVEKLFKEMDCFVEEVIEEHIVNKKMREASKGGHEDYKEDLVDVLLGINNGQDTSAGGLNIGGSLDRDSIKAIILDMFIPGTDTSHALLEWAISELITHPEMMKRVQEEVREIAKGKANIAEDDLNNMHYLQSIIKETMRLHPPVPLLIPRESMEASKIHGYDIPAKIKVVINAYAIGRDPESWKEPNMFEPERFMNSSVDYKGHDFELIPFGAGRRGCPGITLATTTIQLALSNLLFRFDWKLPGDDINGSEAAGDHEKGYIDMAEAAGMVVHKKSPLLLVATEY